MTIQRVNLIVKPVPLFRHIFYKPCYSHVRAVFLFCVNCFSSRDMFFLACGASLGARTGPWRTVSGAEGRGRQRAGGFIAVHTRYAPHGALCVRHVPHTHT